MSLFPFPPIRLARGLRVLRQRCCHDLVFVLDQALASASSRLHQRFGEVHLVLLELLLLNIRLRGLDLVLAVVRALPGLVAAA